MPSPADLIAALSRAYTLTEILPLTHEKVSSALDHVRKVQGDGEGFSAGVSEASLVVEGEPVPDRNGHVKDFVRDLRAAGVSSVWIPGELAAGDVRDFLGALRMATGTFRGGRAEPDRLRSMEGRITVSFGDLESEQPEPAADGTPVAGPDAGGRPDADGEAPPAAGETARTPGRDPAASGLARSIESLFGAASRHRHDAAREDEGHTRDALPVDFRDEVAPAGAPDGAAPAAGEPVEGGETVLERVHDAGMEEEHGGEPGPGVEDEIGIVPEAVPEEEVVAEAGTASGEAAAEREGVPAAPPEPEREDELVVEPWAEAVPEPGAAEATPAPVEGEGPDPAEAEAAPADLDAPATPADLEAPAALADVEAPATPAEAAVPADPAPDLRGAARAFAAAGAEERQELAAALRAGAARLRGPSSLDPLADAVEVLVGADPAGDPDAVDLARELASPGVASRIAARLATAQGQDRAELARVGATLGRPVAEALADALAEMRDAGAQRLYLDAMLALGDAALPVVEAMLADTRWFVLAPAARLVANLEGAEALPRLTALLASPDARVRAETVDALLDVGGDDAATLALGMLEDGDPGVRAAAARAVGILGLAKALKPLQARLEAETEAHVLPEVLRSLGRLGDPGSVPALEKRATGSILRRPLARIRIAAYEALAAIGTPHALALVRDALKDRNRDVRQAARRLVDELEGAAGSDEPEDAPQGVEEGQVLPEAANG